MHVMELGNEDINIVFSMMDTDKDGKIDCNEFVDQLFKMRNQDSQTLLLFIKHVVSELRVKLDAFQVIKEQIDTWMCTPHRNELDGRSSTSRTLSTAMMPSQPSAPRNKLGDAVASDPHEHSHTLPHLDELWCNWQQWEVSKEESTDAGFPEMADNINIVACELDTMKRQIDQDLADLKRDVWRRVDETMLCCNTTQSPVSCKVEDQVQHGGSLSNLTMHEHEDHCRYGAEQDVFSNHTSENLHHTTFARVPGQTT